MYLPTNNVDMLSCRRPDHKIAEWAIAVHSCQLKNIAIPFARCFLLFSQGLTPFRKNPQ
jgi:hypothetical protein